MSECLFCGEPFQPRAVGGMAQKYCRRKCGVAFRTAARRLAMQRYRQGEITAAEIKLAAQSATAARTAHRRKRGHQRVGKGDLAAVAAR
jgi:hypothetical protein